MTPLQRHLYANRLRRCSRRVGQIHHEILRVQRRASEMGRDLLSEERAVFGAYEAQKNRLLDRARELESLFRNL
jgi:hypothetical protein